MTMHTTIAATPTTVETPSPAFLLYTRNPNAIAITINSNEITAVVAFAVLAVSLSSAYVLAGVIVSAEFSFGTTTVLPIAFFVVSASATVRSFSPGTVPATTA